MRLKLFIAFIALLLGLSLYATWGFEGKATRIKAFPVSCLEGWAHRGYVNSKEGVQENSLASYQRAISLGAAGIEMDILYDVDRNDFIVSHDKPYHTQADGSYLTLEEALKVLPKIHTWLDAKNLSSLWPWQASKATERLSAILKGTGHEEQFLVESRNPIYLSQLAENHIHTTLMISANPNKNIVSMWGMIIISKLYFLMGDFSGISMGYPSYKAEVQDNFKVLPAYLSTINDDATIEIFKQQPQIKVFLTDNPKLYGLHCTKP